MLDALPRAGKALVDLAPALPREVTQVLHLRLKVLRDWKRREAGGDEAEVEGALLGHLDGAVDGAGEGPVEACAHLVG